MNMLDILDRRFSVESESEPEMVLDAPEPIEDSIFVDTCDAALLGGVEKAKEFNDFNSTASQLEKTAEALESFLYAARKDRATAQVWNPQTAAMANQIIQMVVGRQTQARKVDLEGFQSRSGAMGAMFSLENAIMDALRDLWQKLKDMVNKIVDSVREFFVKHFSQLGAMKKKAEEVKKKAQEGGKIGKGKAKISNFPQMHVANAVPTFDHMQGTLMTYKEVSEGMSDPMVVSGYSKSLEDITEICDEATVAKFIQSYGELRTSVFKATFAGEALDKISQPIQNGSAPSIAAIDPKSHPSQVPVHDGEIAYPSEELLGGMMIFAILPQNGFPKTLPDALKNNGDELGKEVRRWLSAIRVVCIPANANNKREHDGEKEMTRIPAGQVATLCSIIIEFCEVGMRYKESWRRYEDDNKKFIAKMDRVTQGTSQGGSDEDTGEDVRLRGNVAGGAATWARDVTVWIGNVNRLGGQACRNILNVCISSIDPADH